MCFSELSSDIAHLLYHQIICESNDIIHNSFKALGEGSKTDTTYLDFNKAFESVD